MVAFQCALGESLGLVAPYYNLALVIIVIILFLRLFSLAGRSAYIKPWYFLFFSVMVFVLEEIITIMETKGLIAVSPILFPLLETIIVASFIYMVLLQRQHIMQLK